MACEELVQADPRWQAAMRLRGVEDFSLAMIDPWAAGYTGPEDDPGERRIVRPLTWVRSAPGEHGYARPVEGLIVVVDLDAMEVDRGRRPRRRPAAAQARQLRPGADGRPGQRAAFAAPRADLKPIEITQPEGASFTVAGHGVRWQKWHVRVGFTPREGLVLHELAYDGRPIIYRASLAEMFVPYGDPAPTHRFKNVFDQGEYGVGWLANPLTLGLRLRRRDPLLRRRRQRPGRRADDDPERRSACTRRTTGSAGSTPTSAPRRSRSGGCGGWSISTIATVGNYEYGFFWYLYTDGTIEYEVKLTGVISTGAIAARRAARARHARRARASTARTTSTSSACGWTWRSTATPTPSSGRLRAAAVRAGEPDRDGVGDQAHACWRARRRRAAQIDPLRGRFWRIENPEKVSALGDPVAYKLVPGENVAPMFAPESRFAAARRASRTSTCG